MTATSLEDGLKMLTLTQLEPNFAHLGFLLGPPDAQQSNAYWVFVTFCCFQFSLLKMPSVTPERPQEDLQKPKEEAK